jgi:ABC-type glutathione transport system ATPase component
MRSTGSASAWHAARLLGILGESGSGKSVTLRALMRLLPANCEIGGQIFLDGEDVNGASAEHLEDLRGGRIAMIFQEPITAYARLESAHRPVDGQSGLRRGSGLAIIRLGTC